MVCAFFYAEILWRTRSVLFMRKNLQYIFFNLLLSLRGIIRLVFRTITLLTILGACIMLSQDKSLSLSCFIVGIISWLITIYYDKLLFKIKPHDMDLYLSWFIIFFHAKGHLLIRCPFQIVLSYQGSFNRGNFVVN